MTLLLKRKASTERMGADFDDTFGKIGVKDWFIKYGCFQDAPHLFYGMIIFEPFTHMTTSESQHDGRRCWAGESELWKSNAAKDIVLRAHLSNTTVPPA
ncbi:hypothetical protein Y032_1075g3550 [Ancylostoma ceylanicum]|uniref:Uncharacterized protein n=1 Tax=Ancylostoma ceylanicum TaxID=53326 RepID=A0A016W8K4_9BILA|nr:hypothetical protein Y032_1075g3550 [Ancylostoma ceylanicum]